MVEYYPLTKINSVWLDHLSARPLSKCGEHYPMERECARGCQVGTDVIMQVMEIINTGVGEASGGLKVDGYGNYGKYLRKHIRFWS